jgi:hypothetical protein
MVSTTNTGVPPTTRANPRSSGYHHNLSDHFARTASISNCTGSLPKRFSRTSRSCLTRTSPAISSLIVGVVKRHLEQACKPRVSAKDSLREANE